MVTTAPDFVGYPGVGQRLLGPDPRALGDRSPASTCATAVGLAGLPLGIPVEIEAAVEIDGRPEARGSGGSGDPGLTAG